MSGPPLSPARQAVVVAGVLALLLFPWPRLEEAYSAAFRLLGKLVLDFAGFAEIRIQSQDGAYDVFIHEPGEVWNCGLRSRHTGYLPTALFLALWCGTGLWRADRWRTLFLGGLLVHAFIAAEVAALVLWSLAEHAREHPTHGHASLLGRAWFDSCVGTLTRILVSPIVRTAVPILIWGAVVLRVEHYVRPLGRAKVEPGE
jgi:hypothetical protein